MTDTTQRLDRGLIRVRLGTHRVDLPWADVDTQPHLDRRPGPPGRGRAPWASPRPTWPGPAVDRQVDGNVTVRRPVGFG